MTRNCQQGMVYIVSLIFIFLTAIFAAGILLITSIEHRNVVRDQWSAAALYLAEAGVDDALWGLKNLFTATEWQNADWTTGTTTYTKSVSDFDDSTGEIIGDYDVTITNPSSVTPTIEATGYSPDKTASDNRERTIKITVIVSSGNGNIKAAIVTNRYTKTLGDLVVDGRNHDLDGAVIGSGTLAIHTTNTCDVNGSSTVGGTSSDGTNYPPSQSSSVVNSVVEEGADWTAEGGFPITPDKVMGFSEDTLKNTAMSGRGGSQYVTNPSLLTTPLKGVTYVEISGEWIVGGFDLTGTGILVVHSPTGNTACMKNLNQGTFKGLIIADDIDKVKTTVIGAMVAMSDSTSGNCIGNGTGDVLYSAQAVAKAFWAAGGMTITWQER